jgi:hypothetical protein
MLLILEGYCWAKAWCWVSNARLADAFGCDQGALRRLLRQMEAAGLIHRVPTEHGRPGRLGIVLLKRSDPDLPVADRAGLAEVVALMRRALAPPSAAPDGPKRAPSRRAQAPPRMKTLDPKDDRTLTFARAPGGGQDPEEVPEAPPDPIEPPPGPQEPSAPPEALNLDPAPAEPAASPQGGQAPPPEADPDPAEVAERLEVLNGPSRAGGRFAAATARLWLIERGQLSEWPRRAARPPSPVETPRLASWPTAVGPVETADLIRRLAIPGSGPEAVEAAAQRVADRLKDSHSVGWYRKVFRQVTTGEVPVARALGAWKSASGGTAKCPGAAFNAFLKGGGR